MAWKLHWHRDAHGMWKLGHEWLSTRPPPHRCPSLALPCPALPCPALPCRLSVAYQKCVPKVCSKVKARTTYHVCVTWWEVVDMSRGHHTHGHVTLHARFHNLYLHSIHCLLPSMSLAVQACHTARSYYLQGTEASSQCQGAELCEQ